MDPMGVTLRPMTAMQYAAWRDRSVAGYVEDLIASGAVSAENARERGEQSFRTLMPDGLDSPNTWVFEVLDAVGERVGTLWLGPHPDAADTAFVYDIEIDEAHRGRGLGRATMLAAENVVKQAGFTKLGLNVFGFNERARRLYDSLDYRVVATQMVKDLPGVRAEAGAQT